MIKRLIVIVLLLIVAAGGFAWFALPDAIHDAIEQHGSAVLGSKVEVKQVDLTYKQPGFTLTGLEIENLEGFASKDIMTLSKLSVQSEWGNLKGKVITLDQVTISGLSIFADHKNLTQVNLKQLVDQLESGDSSTTAKGNPASANSRQNSPKIIIKKLVIEEAKVALTSDIIKPHNATLSSLTLTDIGQAQGGVTAKQAAKQILKPLLEKVLAKTPIGGNLSKQALREKAKSKIAEKLNKKLAEKLKDKPEVKALLGGSLFDVDSF